MKAAKGEDEAGQETSNYWGPVLRPRTALR